MKQSTNRTLAALLAIVMAVSACLAFVSCGNDDPASTTENKPIATLPGGDTTTTTAGQPVATTTTGSTPVATTTTGTPTTPVKPGSYVNPLTGEPSVKDLSNTRPLAIVVDNNMNAHPNQTGLDQADILYEALVAPGITRFLAVYADYSAVDSVCNIRSGRDYHLDWAAFHNAVLMCHGASNTVNYDFYSLAAARLGSRWGFVDTQWEYFFSTAEAGAMYGTIANHGERLDLQYDTLFKPAAFEMLLKYPGSHFVAQGQGTITGVAKKSLNFVPYGTKKDMTGASSATNVNLSFTCQDAVGSEKVSFTYNADLDKYLRYQENAPHVDSETKQQLAFTNVLVLLTDVKCVSTGIANDPYMTTVQTKNTSGLGYYFYGGKVIQVRWFSDGNMIALVDSLNNDLTLATGNTYIGYLDNALLSSGQFWN
ncbi:MAG: DUF3048 domain-containing protein [Clostridia bacterium]|nr:DUF3048 domain-containing protein [Clostridia bacterium]